MMIKAFNIPGHRHKEPLFDPSKLPLTAHIKGSQPGPNLQETSANKGVFAAFEEPTCNKIFVETV